MIQQRIDIPNAQTVRRHVLDNGITVLLYHNPYSQTVVVEGGLWAGAASDDRSTAGRASFVANMLLRGSARRSFEQIYADLEAVGGSVSFSAGYQMTDFSADGLAEDLDLLLDILSDALRRPTFDAAQVEQVRVEKLARLQMRQNDTRSMAGLAFHELLYGVDHPYGRSVSGYLDSVPAITRDMLADFHARYYGPQNMIITLVGGVEPEAALAKIARVLGDWHNPAYGAPPAIPAAQRPAETLQTHVAMPHKTQSDIVLGLPGPLRAASDYVDAKLANTILGVFGMMGRLGKSVREEQGLAYYARSVLRGSLGPVPWYVSTGVAPDKVTQALESIRSEIRRIQEEPVPAAELADSQAYLTGSLPMSIETNSGVADVLFNIELFDLGLDYLENYNADINAVTPERVQAAARRYFSADEIAIAVAGP